MNTHIRMAATGVAAIVALTACTANADKTPSKKTTELTRAAQCEQFGNRQYQPQKAVSGTTVRSTYDEKTGFCTVTAENKTPGNTYSSRIRTNVFDPSSTMVNFETTIQPMRVQWRETPMPQRVLCSDVKPDKNGKLLCTPYKPAPDDMFAPFAIFNDTY